MRIPINDELWWAIFEDSESTVAGHLREHYSAKYMALTPRRQYNTEDYIEFDNDKYYSLFVLRYSEYL
jgi:hypothetical protein